MTIQKPTVDDLRTLAHNLQSEGQNSRAELVYRTATFYKEQETALAAADELEKAISNYEGDDYMDEIFKKALAYRAARKATE